MQLYQNASYINGQLLALEAVIKVLIRTHPDRERVRQEIIQQIESLRIAGLNSTMPEEFHVGIDHVAREAAKP